MRRIALPVSIFSLNALPGDVLNEQTARPLAYLLLGVLAVVVAWAGIHSSRALWQQRYSFAWRISFRMTGWISVLLSAGAVGFFAFVNLLDPDLPVPQILGPRIVETTIPLAMGIVAAYLFSPEDEPPVELILAAPRPLAWLLAERIAAMMGVLGGVALSGAALIYALGIKSSTLSEMILRVLPPGLFLAGLGLFITLVSRQAVFGVSMILVIWFATCFLGDALLPIGSLFWPLSELQPYLWPVHAYLQPGVLSDGAYVLNRAILTLVGLGFMVLAARQLQNEEWVLLGKKATSNKISIMAKYRINGS